MFLRATIWVTGLALLLGLGACSPKENMNTDPWAEPETSARQPQPTDTLTYDFLEEAEPIQEGGMEAEADLPAIAENAPVVVEEQETPPASEVPPAATEVPPAAGERVVTPPAPPVDEGPLFWVQIFASSNRQSAEEFALEADERLEERVRILYLEPHYKVLVGGFPQREAAVALRAELVGLGYEGAWIFEK